MAHGKLLHYEGQKVTLWYTCIYKVFVFLSPVSVVLSGWESLTPLHGTLIHRRLAPSRCWYSFTYRGRMESWVSLDGKEGRTNIQISAEQGIELGTLWSESRDLTNCANHARPKSLLSPVILIIITMPNNIFAQLISLPAAATLEVRSRCNYEEKGK